MELLETSRVQTAVFKGLLDPKMDAKNQEILQAITAERMKEIAKSCTPLVGEVVSWPNGETRRVSHDWQTQLQTARKDEGRYFVSNKGRANFTGSPMPAQMIEFFVKTSKVTSEPFWFFSHNMSGEGRALQCTLPCRVWVFLPFRRSLEQAVVHPRAIECVDNYGINHPKYQDRIASIMAPKVITDPYNG